MTLVLSEFSRKKALEYSSGAKTVLVDFAHGLGDTVMFLPVLEELKRSLPLAKVDLLTHFGQEEVFGVKAAKYDDYEVVVTLPYAMAESSGMTKSEACCVRELGIDPSPVKKNLSSSWFKINYPKVFSDSETFRKSSPFVLFAFQSTALPDPCNCPQPLAEALWREVESIGKIPIECHFSHCFANPRNAQYPFVGSSTTRKLPPRVQLLADTIKTSFAFVGVATGSTVVAMAGSSNRTAFLERAYHRRDYFSEVGPAFNINEYRPGSLAAWLKGLE